jgi:HemY protein N-terminus
VRRLIVILLLIALAVGLGILLRFNHGNVAVFWPPYRLDVSVNFAMLFLLASFALAYFVIRALSTTLRLPTVVREYRAARARDLGVQALADGIVPNAWLRKRGKSLSWMRQLAYLDREPRTACVNQSVATSGFMLCPMRASINWPCK